MTNLTCVREQRHPDVAADFAVRGLGHAIVQSVEDARGAPGAVFLKRGPSGKHEYHDAAHQILALQC